MRSSASAMMIALCAFRLAFSLRFVLLGLGLLLGLVLPHLIPSRKRKDRWMN